MKVLIVHAHPEPQSFTAALRDQAVATLEAQGHEVQVSDLYKMNWNPCLLYTSPSPRDGLLSRMPSSA